MESGFFEHFDITAIQPADYNPRKISQESIDALRASISAVGIVKPVILREHTIVAGHQRVKALSANGIKTAPAYLLSKKTNSYDEMRFNQLHNGTDLDFGDEAVTVPPSDTPGFKLVKPLSGNMRAAGIAVRQEICQLILKYGNWGACTATLSGNVIHAAQYALACKMLKIECRVCYIPDEKETLCRQYLSRKYGEFDYEHLARNTFVQTFAQLPRLSGKNKLNRSPNYELTVIPLLKQHPEMRILDFGCGRGDYVRLLQGQGFHIIGLEFFNRKNNKALDMPKTQRMADELIREIREHGLFDAVICDYVLNSVNSSGAENDVLNCISIFTREGGRLFFSGRSRDKVEQQEKRTHSASKGTLRRGVELMDDNSFSSLYRKGHWFFQKFHTKQEILEKAAQRGMGELKYIQDSLCYRVEAKKMSGIPRGEAVLSIQREFNMAYNAGGTVTLNRHEDMLEVLKDYL